MSGLFDLSGRTALVTGSSRGIGFELATGLLAAGAHVILHGRHEDRVSAARRRLGDAVGDRVDTVVFDVTESSAVAEAIRYVERSVAELDILVNNAGIQLRKSMLELDPAEWDQVWHTNVSGAFLTGREVARGMTQRGAGKIINICSVQSELARPSIGAYTTAKGGLRNLTKAMAAEWGPCGVQVNGLAPGYIRTELTKALVDDAEFSDWVVGRTPSRRWGETLDLVGPAVFLASQASDFVNGQVLFVDGGMTAVV